MKKHLILIACIVLSVHVMAEKNPFKRHQERIKTFELNKKTISPKIELLKTNATVPQLTKQYGWNFGLSTWEPQTATRKVYLNDLLTKELFLSFSLIDTMNINEYTYDNERRLILKLNKYKSSNGTFVPSSREVTIYLNNGLKIITSYEYYDTFNNTWDPQFRYTAEFNSRGDEISNFQESYVNGQWKIQNGYQSTYTHLNSTSNKVTEAIYSNYDTVTNAFVPYYKDVYNYNASEQMIEYVGYTYNFSTPVPSYKDSVFYTNGIPTYLIEYEYNTQTNSYELWGKIDQISWLSFDPNINIFDNEPIAFTFYVWNNNSWLGVERSSTIFPDNNGSYISTNEEYINNTWVNISRSKILYNANKDLIEEAYEDYNPTTNTWDVNYGVRLTLQYNINSNIIDEQQEYYNDLNLAWEKTNRFEYSEFITIALGVNTYKNTIEAILYPNPSTNGTVFLNVNMETSSTLNIKITDMKGSIVYNDERDLGKGLNTIELSNIKQGLYIVELTSEYGLARQKLVVR